MGTDSRAAGEADLAFPLAFQTALQSAHQLADEAAQAVGARPSYEEPKRAVQNRGAALHSKTARQKPAEPQPTAAPHQQRVLRGGRSSIWPPDSSWRSVIPDLSFLALSLSRLFPATPGGLHLRQRAATCLSRCSGWRALRAGPAIGRYCRSSADRPPQRPAEAVGQSESPYSGPDKRRRPARPSR